MNNWYGIQLYRCQMILASTLNCAFISSMLHMNIYGLRERAYIYKCNTYSARSAINCKSYFLSGSNDVRSRSLAMHTRSTSHIETIIMFCIHLPKAVKMTKANTKIVSVPSLCTFSLLNSLFGFQLLLLVFNCSFRIVVLLLENLVVHSPCDEYIKRRKLYSVSWHTRNAVM